MLGIGLSRATCGSRTIGMVFLLKMTPYVACNECRNISWVGGPCNISSLALSAEGYQLHHAFTNATRVNKVWQVFAIATHVTYRLLLDPRCFYV